MRTRTTIQLRKETRKRLKTFKLVKRESFDELINRLIDYYSEGKDV